MASLAGTKSASSEPFHLMRNISSPEESVAPIIRSGSRVRSKPRGLSSSPFFFFEAVSPKIWKKKLKTSSKLKGSFYISSCWVILFNNAANFKTSLSDSNRFLVFSLKFDRMRARSQKPLKLNYNFYFKKVSYMYEFLLVKMRGTYKKDKVSFINDVSSEGGGSKSADLT